MQSSPAAFLSDYMRISAEGAMALAADAAAAAILERMAAAIVAAFQQGGRLFTAGNGGSAADAAHIAAEFLSRCHFDRAPLPAVALAANPAALTAFANDYGTETLFARQVSALGRAGDVLLLLSTSGNSPNILRAAEAALAAGMVVMGFAGSTGGALAGIVPLVFKAPAGHAQVVQQLHLQAAHGVIGMVEIGMFGARM
jgi:D-sedoheptulose 7-phosphate isomerase